MDMSKWYHMLREDMSKFDTHVAGHLQNTEASLARLNMHFSIGCLHHAIANEPHVVRHGQAPGQLLVTSSAGAIVWSS